MFTGRGQMLVSASISTGRACWPLSVWTNTSCSLLSRPQHSLTQTRRPYLSPGGRRGGLLATKSEHSTLFSAAVQAAATNMVPGKGYRAELEAACKAVFLASKLCQQVQLGLKESAKQDKSDSSPVTIADYAAQAIVAWSLLRSFPGVPFSMVAEEDAEDLRGKDGQGMRSQIAALVNKTVSEAEPGKTLSEKEVLDLIDQGVSPGGSEGRHWVLDPIDGTRGFVGMRQYAVCLGMIQDGQVVLGVLGCPNMPQAPLTDADGAAGAAERGGTEGVGAMFAASRGSGAYVGPMQAGVPSRRIHVRDVEDMRRVRFMESFESRHSDQALTARAGAQLGIAQPPLRLDSQAKYGALSRGDASIYMRFPHAGYREKLWDHCAGSVIVEEAGGVITDASGAPLDFGKGRWLDLDRGIVAAPPTVHSAVLEAIRAVS